MTTWPSGALAGAQQHNATEVGTERSDVTPRAKLMAYRKNLWQAHAGVGLLPQGPNLPHAHAKAEGVNLLSHPVLLLHLHRRTM